MTDAKLVQLKPCPFCGSDLKIRKGVNPYGHCPTEGCHSNRAQVVPLCDGHQVSAWNRRSAEPVSDPYKLGGDSALKVAKDIHEALARLIYGLPDYLDANNLTDEEKVIQEAQIALDVTANRLAHIDLSQPLSNTQELAPCPERGLGTCDCKQCYPAAAPVVGEPVGLDVDADDMRVIGEWINEGERIHNVPAGRIKALWQAVRRYNASPHDHKLDVAVKALEEIAVLENRDGDIMRYVAKQALAQIKGETK